MVSNKNGVDPTQINFAPSTPRFGAMLEIGGAQMVVCKY